MSFAFCSNRFSIWPFVFPLMLRSKLCVSTQLHGTIEQGERNDGVASIAQLSNKMERRTVVAAMKQRRKAAMPVQRRT